MVHRRADTIEKRGDVDVVLFLLHVTDDLLFHQLLRTIGGDHLCVENALQIVLRQTHLQLAEGLHDARLDLVDLRVTQPLLLHRNLVSEEHVQVLDIDQSLVVTVDSTRQRPVPYPQLEDQFGVLASNAFFARQASREELGVVDQT